ncbi:MAG: hypothetical protein WAK91_14350 [Candidatus Acidiferrales bacterium]|jgi:hypothetical protein
MDQIIHIFKKDVRHHWLEISVSVALLVTFAWLEPSNWTPVAMFSEWERFLAGLVPTLVPISWVLLITRVIQGESLVGDQQFWITRPYDWKKLLAAKLLFVFTFVYVPLLVFDVYLLKRASFGVFPHLHGLAYILGFLTVLLILPAAAIAVVTRSIGQVVLVILGILVYIIAIASVIQYVPNLGISRAESPTGFVAVLTVVATCMVVVVRQYATRVTAKSWAILIAGALAMPVIVAASPYRILIAHAYPRRTVGQQLPVVFTFDPAKPNPDKEFWYNAKKNVGVRLRLIVSGVSRDTFAVVDGTSITIQAPGGTKWTSGWLSGGPNLGWDTPNSSTDIAIDEKFFDSVQSTPVHIHMSFAVATFRSIGSQNVIVASNSFNFPGGGRCSLNPVSSSEIWCLFPLARPFVTVRATAGNTGCSSQKNDVAIPPGTVVQELIWNRDADPAEPAIRSVIVERVQFSDWDAETKRSRELTLCPGAPLTVTKMEESERFQSELEIDDVRLSDYELKAKTWGQD